MGFAPETLICLLCVILLLPAPSTSQDTFTRSRATYYGSPDCYGTPSGACGFGEFGRTVNDGSVAGVSRLYRNGTGCGACYQVRCTTPEYCSDEGVKIVVSDYGEGDTTDFILSPRAFVRLARANVAKELLAYGVIDVEYRRVSCQYSGHNLMVKVHENSRFPHYLALLVIYVAGQNDITAVELWQEDSQQWRGMRRAYGAVWDMANAPTGSGSIKLRFQVCGSAGTKWVQSRNGLPGDWKPGVAYDSAIQLVA
ncbi:expansin-like B1 [Corylus avellana]|uniref:expansin-like B1 n=1 Tax=Corylus avellana TaxID=13451 RepID=UPI001E21D1EF|nr:expansin-like B1 [Corylus avellana]